MDNLKRLASKANETFSRILIQFDPNEIGEEWCVKYYPEINDDAHYYAYSSDLDHSARLLLDELRGL